jgi:hypothetical protein
MDQCYIFWSAGLFVTSKKGDIHPAIPQPPTGLISWSGKRSRIRRILVGNHILRPRMTYFDINPFSAEANSNRLLALAAAFTPGFQIDTHWQAHFELKLWMIDNVFATCLVAIWGNHMFFANLQFCMTILPAKRCDFWVEAVAIVNEPNILY